MKTVLCFLLDFLLGLLKVIGFILEATFWLLETVGPYIFIGGMILLFIDQGGSVYIYNLINNLFGSL